LLDSAITGNPNISPSAETMHRMFVLALRSPETESFYARVWEEIKGGDTELPVSDSPGK
jgi:hypothetical protein